MVPALEIAGLVKTWPRAAGRVLDGVDFTVAPGETVLLEGANGAGKTTLMRLVSGLLEADAGTVRVTGLAAGEDRVAFHRQLGLVTAGNVGLYARLSVLQHLQFSARLQLIPRTDRIPWIETALREFALLDFVRRRVDRLSMGQRQRLRLALGTLHRPPLLLLDEPATSLDQSGRELLAAAISRHRTAGGATVWLAPTGETVAVPVDRRVVLVEGRLTQV